MDIDGIGKTRGQTAFTVTHGNVAAELKDGALHREALLAEYARDLCMIAEVVSAAES